MDLGVLLIFIIGTAVGSFLNVLIDRIPREESVVKGRSYCDSCKRKLAWYDLIPLLSWVMLGGKCRYCKGKISWQYPVVELATGILFVVVRFIAPQVSDAVNGITTDLIFHWFIVSALLVIFMVDLKYYIIPDRILVPAAVVTFIYRLGAQQAEPLQNYLFTALGAAAFFGVLILITRGKGMGMGDVKYGLFMGLLLGLPSTIVALYAAFLTGAVVSVILLLSGKKKFGQIIPFGPFLVFGTIIGLFWGEILWGKIGVLL